MLIKDEAIAKHDNERRANKSPDVASLKSGIQPQIP
jgi:hypothetical protein